MLQGQRMQENAAVSRKDAVLVMFGQQYCREHQGLMKIIDQILQEQPSWTAVEVMTYANKIMAQKSNVGSMQVHPGVVVMSQSMSGKMTNNTQGEPGTMSRNHPSNAVSLTGGDRQSVQRLTPEH